MTRQQRLSAGYDDFAVLGVGAVEGDDLAGRLRECHAGKDCGDEER